LGERINNNVRNEKHPVPGHDVRGKWHAKREWRKMRSAGYGIGQKPEKGTQRGRQGIGRDSHGQPPDNDARKGKSKKWERRRDEKCELSETGLSSNSNH